MSKQNKIRPNHRSVWTVWATSILTLAFGLAMLLWPGLTQEWILNITGAITIVIGIACIVRYILQRDPFDASDWDLGIGLTALIAGILLIVFKNELIHMLFTLFGIALVVSGIAKIQIAFNLRRLLTLRWFLPLLCSAASVALGVLVVARPGSIFSVLTQFTGAAIVVETVLDMFAYLFYRRELVLRGLA